ncbi:protein unzipped [Scaptodrosophila lebanonensis]|uniref:Protein unzipped n=1 Tax=Drosophila lebanonensis TaxID=7225 RepID=A0A6J2TIA8_DROLE|nr:protein unzipped [Scaptodrosophila lebanonensis]XP_030375175.1 protein unzipped [Scaptodrosophila lebanonensis]
MGHIKMNLKTERQRRSTNRAMSPRLYRIGSLFSLSLLLQLAMPTSAAVHPVFTYQNASIQQGQLLTSSTLVWETYDSKDPKQLEFAVEGGKYITEDEHYPIYVCRVTIDGVPTSGHTEKIKQRHQCVAAHYKRGKYESFDVLVNKGHLGKVAWKPWRKFNAGVPVGAIRIADDSYIARHRAPNHQQHAEQQQQNPEHEHEQHWGADYNLGHLDKVGMGKIKVVENEREKYYTEGEVLVETEPFRYELRDIKLDRLRTDLRENLTELTTTKLENLGETYSTVETVISYHFNYMQYWGSHEGVARGLPTKVFEKDVATPAEINWGLKHSEKRYETKSVHTKLWPGTAINVTLRGNYVTLEAPYTAKLFAFYYGSDESVSRKITSEVRKSYLKDVKLEFSPVYWIENGTIVPTTTTTSTTSTTTHATTTSTNEPTPINEPPLVHVEHVGDKHSGPDTLEKTLQDSPASNEVNSNDVPDNLANPHKDAALAGFGGAGGGGATAISSTVMMLFPLLFVAFVLNL